MRSYQPTSHVVTSTPIKSQIIIMSSKEMPPSSDESEMIDVGSEMSNPFGNINVDEIPIEIADDLMDSQQDNSEIQVTGLQSNPYITYEPLDDENWIKAALKFNLVINSNTHPVKHYGVSDRLSSPPTVTISAKGNGVCLFNSLSLLLTGRDTYSAIIWHVVCNYIDNPMKHTFLRPYIPENFATGKQHMTSKNMCNFSTWGTEVEIIAFAQISGFDVIVNRSLGQDTNMILLAMNVQRNHSAWLMKEAIILIPFSMDYCELPNNLIVPVSVKNHNKWIIKVCVVWNNGSCLFLTTNSLYNWIWAIKNLAESKNFTV